MWYRLPTSQIADGKFRIWRGRNDDRHDSDTINQRDRYGGGNVMVWDGISHQGKTDLVTINGALNS